MDQAQRGAAAIASSDFPAAVTHYTEALKQNPQAVDYYIKRSIAFTRLSPPLHQDALKDAELAVVLATKRAKRELIAQAQLRRAIALFGLEKFADSKQCFEWVKKLNEKEKSLAIWEMKLAGKLKGIEDGLEDMTTVKEVPEVKIPDAVPAKKVEKPDGSKQEPKATNAAGAGVEDKTTPAPSFPPLQGVQTPSNKIRHEWYQQNEVVIVSLFCKGIPKDKASVEIKTASLEVSFPLPTGSDYNFSLDPLFAAIDPSASSYKIMSTKAEFTLKKASPGQKWATLEGTGPVEITQNESIDTDASVKKAVLADKGPAYPTSSKSGPKDWDKLASNMTKKPKKDGEDDEDDDMRVDENEDGDPVNGFFKTLFKGADDDTKRAMMKSYQESNGTALSTNWSEVSRGKVETTPPDGMEAKPW